jgi:hypothetical protein
MRRREFIVLVAAVSCRLPFGMNQRELSAFADTRHGCLEVGEFETSHLEVNDGFSNVYEASLRMVKMVLRARSQCGSPVCPPRELAARGPPMRSARMRRCLLRGPHAV